MKMHLKARAPNEGARQLAQWVCTLFAGNPVAAATRLRITEQQVERLLSGELVPGTTMVTELAQRGVPATRRDWRRPPAGGWFDVDAAQAKAA